MNLVVFNDQNTAHALRKLCFKLVQHFDQLLALHRLQHVANSPERQGSLRIVVARDDMDRNMPGADIPLQTVEDGEAGLIG